MKVRCTIAFAEEVSLGHRQRVWQALLSTQLVVKQGPGTYLFDSEDVACVLEDFEEAVQELDIRSLARFVHSPLCRLQEVHFGDAPVGKVWLRTSWPPVTVEKVVPQCGGGPCDRCGTRKQDLLNAVTPWGMRKHYCSHEEVYIEDADQYNDPVPLDLIELVYDEDKFDDTDIPKICEVAWYQPTLYGMKLYGFAKPIFVSESAVMETGVSHDCVCSIMCNDDPEMMGINGDARFDRIASELYRFSREDGFYHE